jgi:DNA polymerase IV
VTPEIYATAADLFTRLGLQRARIRLVGVRVEGLLDSASVTRQLQLGQRPYGWEDAERAVDKAVSRFGGAAVRPATLLHSTGWP